MAWIKRLTLACLVTGLLASNLLTLTSHTFNSAVSGLAATYFGVRTVTGALQAQLASKDAAIKRHKASANNRKAAAKRFGTRLTSRTKRVAAKSIAAIPAEAIPLLGAAVLVAEAGYELYAACETLRDLDRLYLDLGLDAEQPADALQTVCAAGPT
jgi:hypothetical protein